MSLTEKKRYYIADFRHTAKQAIDWWRVKAAKRFEKLQSNGKLRKKLEIWEPGAEVDIIR